MNFYLPERLHGSFLSLGGISFPSVSKRRLPVSVSFGVPLWVLSQFVVLLQRVTFSVFRHSVNVLVSMRPLCPELWASNSGRLRCWRQWWPTLRPWLVTIPIYFVRIFLWCLPSFLPSSTPSHPGNDELSRNIVLGHESMFWCPRGLPTSLKAPCLPPEMFVHC